MIKITEEQAREMLDIVFHRECSEKYDEEWMKKDEEWMKKDIETLRKEGYIEQVDYLAKARGLILLNREECNPFPITKNKVVDDIINLYEKVIKQLKEGVNETIT